MFKHQKIRDDPLIKSPTDKFRVKLWHNLRSPLIHKFTVFDTLTRRILYQKNKSRAKPVDLNILANIEGIADYNIPYNWFTKTKKLGISGVARLKNSADFLEICVKAFLPYLDEVILVAEKSTDNTSEICEKLVREHPDKIKYFYYEYEVFFRNSEQPMPPTNSVHSFAYFTNYAFSKTSYQYVMRLDDDILPIPKFWKNLKNIYINNTGKYLLYHGINIVKSGNKIGVLKNLPLCGTGGDNGVYPVSEYTYFTQGIYEDFHHQLQFSRLGLGFIHLKQLKKDHGVAVYKNTKHGKFYEELVQNSEIDDFENYTSIGSSEIYKILLDNKII